MSREIKFKAWDRMVEQMLTVRTVDKFTIQSLSTKRYVILQYTGLKDSQGKEIYESDLLHDEMDALWVVQYDNNQTAFVCSSLDDHEEYYVPVGQLLSEMHLEVIGNIYEDSHLLKNESEDK